MENKNIERGKLVEIKKGQTGTGLLIENDGYVSYDISDYNKRVIKEALESRQNGEWNIPNPFVLDVILQKYGIENANKRIYPEDILKREVAKYQELIRQHMALGECYTEDAQCLTSEGWKNICDVKNGDSIITLNTETNKTEYQKVSNKPSFKWNDNLVCVQSDKIDDLLTPNHSYPLYNQDNSFYGFVPIKDIMDNQNIYGEYLIPTSLTIDNDNSEFECIGNLQFSVKKYDCMVYCVEVPNHTWYVMQNGKCHWTKNCNHPAESTIDLGRISHNIIECHWEGNTLVGKLELNLTEGFRRYGICSSLGDTCANLIINGYKIGISSRAIGSVENRLGKTIVSGDLELVSFDLVATPSTPGAYVGKRQDLEQYIESDETVKGKPKLNEKINKIKSILS